MMQDATTAHDLNGLEVTDTAGINFPLVNLTLYEKRLGLYVNRMFCSDCWMTTARNIGEVAKEIGIDTPFILADDFNQRDIKLLARKDSLGLPIYLLKPHESDILKRLASQGEPFIFYLHSNGMISSILYLADIMKNDIVKYLKISYKDPIEADSLEITNSVVDLGYVPYRRKIPIQFLIINNTPINVKILEVKSSCGCLEIDPSFKEIKGISETVLNVQYYSESMGSFRKIIKVFTDEREKPYIFIIKGYCN